MLLPDYIDINESERYNLSIRVEEKKFSFTLHDTENKAFCYISRDFFEETSLLENIKQSIFDMSFLTHKYMSVKLIYVSTKYEFVPSYIFEKQKLDDLYKLSHTDSLKKIVESEELLKGAITIFDMDSELFNFLQRSILGIDYYHHSHILANYFHQKTKIPSLHNQAFINFDGNRSDLFFFKHQKLIHVASHEDIKAQDLAFHILSLWEKAEYKQLEDSLSVSGESPIKEKTINILKDYIQQIEEIGLPSDVELLGHSAKQTPLDLLALSL